MLTFHNILSPSQIKSSDLDSIFSLALHYNKTPHKTHNIANGKILATLFFEPSTRTRLSFETAILRLGGEKIVLENGNSSSLTKGETLFDTGKIISGYADIAVIRHPLEGSVAEFASGASIPVINGGDGSNHHPTQTLVDLYAVYKTQKRLSNLSIMIVGDLKHSRTASSFLDALSTFGNNNMFTLVSHSSLALSDDKKQEKNGCKITVTNSIGSLKDVDVLYMIRTQKERFQNIEDYNKVKDLYSINASNASGLKQTSIIIHPLPRVDEIHASVDSLPQAYYFKQASDAVFIRMSLIQLMLGLQ